MGIVGLGHPTIRTNAQWGGGPTQCSVLASCCTDLASWSLATSICPDLCQFCRLPPSLQSTMELVLPQFCRLPTWGVTAGGGSCSSVWARASSSAFKPPSGGVKRRRRETPKEALFFVLFCGTDFCPPNQVRCNRKAWLANQRWTSASTSARDHD